MKASAIFNTSSKKNPTERNQIAVLKFCADWKSAEEIATGLELSHAAVSQSLREVMKDKLVELKKDGAADEPKRVKTTAKGKQWLSAFGN